MCFFKTPKIEVPEVATPAATPPPLEDAPSVKGVDIGGDDKESKELGAKKSNKKGKSALKIEKSKPAATGVNRNLGMNNTR